MNRIHSKVWNKQLGQLVVASEFATSDSAGATGAAGAAGALRRTILAAAVAPLLALAALAAPPASAQEAGWVVSDGDADLAIGDGGTVAFQGGNNISVDLTGAADDAVVEISLNDNIDLGASGSVAIGNTVVNSGGVVIGAGAVVLNSAGLSIAGGPSVTTAGINAAGRITGVAAGAAATDAVNFAQLSAVQAAAEAAGAGWTVTDGSGNDAGIGPGGTVTFSGDGNIAVAQTGSDDAGAVSIGLNPNLTVTSISAGGTTLNASGLTIAGGPSVTTTGIDAGGMVITNLGETAIGATSTAAVTGAQVHELFFGQGTASGIRYFRANSTAPDAEASGTQSVAIGPRSVAAGSSSLAAGDGAGTADTAAGALALGQGATAGTEGAVNPDGAGAIAIGRNSQAAGNSTLAAGDGATVESEYVAGATALGAGARVSGNESTGGTAVGANAHASAGNATALGAGAAASGVGSIAVGQAEADAGSALAAGNGAYAGTTRGIALGSGAGVGTEGAAGGDRTDHIAIGTNAGQNVTGNLTTAIGYGAGQGVIGDDNVAIGTGAGGGLDGNNNISVGTGANTGVAVRSQAIAIGDGTAAGSNSVALGSGARATGQETLALGKDARASENGVAVGAHAFAEDNNVALGRNSAAFASDSSGSGYLTGSAAPGSAVSVGNSNPGEAFQRRIINVADGAQRYDAVNVGQLQGAQQAVANLVGGNVSVGSDGSFGGYVIELTDQDDVVHQYTTVAAAINAVSSGEISVLPGNAVIRNPDGTITVAAGALGDQAVNVEQLETAIAESGVKYFSANTTIGANRANDGATGADAMALGPAAVAGGSSSLAIGHAASVDVGAHNGVAIGQGANAKAINTTVIGNAGAAAYGMGGVALGQAAVSRGLNSIVMGTGAQADPKSGATVDNAIVIGTDAEATADDGVAIGQSALASEDRAVAQGFDAHAMAVDSQAFGTRARTTGTNSQASGTDARASGTNAIATGTNARGYAADGIAMGTGAVSGLASPLPGDAARNRGSIAIGDSSLANDLNALALGVDAAARAESATAIGDGAEATAADAFAAGTGAEASAVDAFAAGTGAEASAAQALAAGAGARATAESASAFGRGAQALHEGSVALGSGSITAGATGTAGATIDRVEYTYAGTDPVATVSVGSAGAERTITNVAAGRVLEDSTDAINGSQLFRTNQAVTALGNNLDTAGASVAAALGGASYYDADDHTVVANLSVRGNTYTNVQGALTYVGQGWNVSAAGGDPANVGPGGAVDFGNSDGNIVVSRDPAGTDLVFDLADAIEVDSVDAGGTVVDAGGVSVGDSHLGSDGLVIAGGPSVTGAGISAGGSRITNVLAGQAGTDAVNVNQLNALANSPLTFAGDAGTAVERRLGQTVNVVGGVGSAATLTDGNIGVVADGTATLSVRLNKDIDLGDSGSVAIGDTTIDNDGLEIDDGAGNITRVGAGLVSVIANPSTGPQNTITIDANTGTIGGLTNTTFDPDNITSGQAATEDQLRQVSQAVSAGWHVSVDGEGAVAGNNVGPGGTVDFSNTDGNIQIDRQGTSLAFELADDIEVDSVTAGDTVLDADGVRVGDDVALGGTGLVISDGPSVTVDGIDAGGMVISNVAAGAVNAASTEAVNGSQLYGVADNVASIVGGETVIDPTTGEVTVANIGNTGQGTIHDAIDAVNTAANAGWNLTDAGGNQVNIGPGGLVTFEGDGNLSVVQSGADQDGVIAISLERDLDVDSVTTGDARLDTGGVTVDDGAGNVTRVAADGTRVEDDEGNVTVIAADGTTVTDGTATTSIGAGVIEVAGGVNRIVINGDAGTIGGLTNTSFDPDNITSGQAATEDQLRQVSNVANAGWNVLDGAGNQANIGPDGGLTFVAGNGNLSVELTDDTNNAGVMEITLADDIQLSQDGSFTIGDSTTGRGSRLTADGLMVIDWERQVGTAIGQGYIVAADEDGMTWINGSGVAIGNEVHLGHDGLVIEDGPSVTLAGINAGNMVITSVAAGEVSATSTEAINGSQLFGMGESMVSVIGGDATLNPDGTISTSNIGGTGYDNIDDAIRAANEAANAGWTVTDGAGNDANIGPGGTVGFSGDGNISVTQTGSDNNGQIQVSLSRDLDVDSITAGNTVIDTDGVRVGDDVHLGETGLVIEGGPSVTVDGIDAGGSVVSNVAAGVEDTDAVNVGQLREVGDAVVDLGDRINQVEGDVADLQAGAAGPFQVSQEAPVVAPTPTGQNSAAGGSGADASGANATALGNQAVASGANSTAVGQGAQATHDNSVALGQGSATTVGAQTGYEAAYVGSSNSSGEVNVGNRTISGVAPGMAGTDAVNVNQLNAGVNHAVVTANEYTDQRFNQVQSDVWHLHGRVDELEKEINSGVATAMAMRQAPYVAGATTYYAGFGAYKDQGALGVSLRRTSDNGRWSLEGGFSANRDGAGGYIGVSGVLGSK